MSIVDAPHEGGSAAVAAPPIDVAVVEAGAQPFRRQRSLWGDAWRRLVRNKLAMAGLFGILFLLFLTIAADWLMPYEYDWQLFGNIAEPPSPRVPARHGPRRPRHARAG